MSLSQYFDRFLARRKAAEACSMNMATNQLVLSIAKAKLDEMGVTNTNQDYKVWLVDVKTHANEQFFTLVFIGQAGDKFDECRRELQNDFTKGTNHLPKTVVDDSYALLQNYDSALQN